MKENSQTPKRSLDDCLLAAWIIVIVCMILVIFAIPFVKSATDKNWTRSSRSGASGITASAVGPNDALLIISGGTHEWFYAVVTGASEIWPLRGGGITGWRLSSSGSCIFYVGDNRVPITEPKINQYDTLAANSPYPLQTDLTARGAPSTTTATSIWGTSGSTLDYLGGVTNPVQPQINTARGKADTAYGWGDHSTQNYLDKDTDPYLTGTTPHQALHHAGGPWELDIENLASGTSRIFDKATDTLDQVPNGSAYNLIPALTKTQIDSLLSGDSPYYTGVTEPVQPRLNALSDQSGATPWESGTTIRAKSGNIQFVEGSNVTIDVAQDGEGAKITIASTASGGGSGSGVTTIQASDGTEAESTALGDAASGVFIIGAQGIESVASGNTITMKADGAHSMVSTFVAGENRTRGAPSTTTSVSIWGVSGTTLDHLAGVTDPVQPQINTARGKADTAYGWGDHSTQNYLDKDTDPYLTGTTPHQALHHAGGPWELDIANLASGTSRIFDKATDTLDQVPDGTTYKLITAAKKSEIESLLGGSTPYAPDSKLNAAGAPGTTSSTSLWATPELKSDATIKTAAGAVAKVSMYAVPLVTNDTGTTTYIQEAARSGVTGQSGVSKTVHWTIMYPDWNGISSVTPVHLCTPPVSVYPNGVVIVELNGEVRSGNTTYNMNYFLWRNRDASSGVSIGDIRCASGVSKTTTGATVIPPGGSVFIHPDNSVGAHQIDGYFIFYPR